jgi:hypothetical protein
MESAVMLEARNLAISAGPLGTVLGLQFAAVFQSLLAGADFHVALPAPQGCTKKNAEPNE